MKALDHIHHLFFLGIGGVGMSALARYFAARGVKVSGYDRTSTTLTRELEDSGIDIIYSDRTELVADDIDMVINTPAVPLHSQLYTYFQTAGIPMHKRAEVLGMISESFNTIAVAGTHGKTTTTAIVTHLLFDAGIPITGFVGGIMSGYNTNYLYSGDRYVIVEADEFDRSFLHLNPTIGVVLSMDADHLDIYGDASEVINGFKSFIHKIKIGGKLFIHHSLRIHFEAAEWIDLSKKIDIYTFGNEQADIFSTDISYESNATCHFDFHEGILTWRDLTFSLPGEHNVSNASVAIAIARHLDIGESEIRHSISNFKGIKRRFEFVVSESGSAYIDDYAHHPSELQAAINTVKSLFPERKIMGVFQPHLYSRTRDFATEFATVMDQLDIPVLLDIYPAREEPIDGVTSRIIFDKMQNPNKELVRFDDLVGFVTSRHPTVLITMGAGDIDTLVPKLKLVMENNKIANL